MDVTVCREYNSYRFKDLVNVYKVSKELYDLEIVEKFSTKNES